jgi:hypothetical protein
VGSHSPLALLAALPEAALPEAALPLDSVPVADPLAADPPAADPLALLAQSDPISRTSEPSSEQAPSPTNVVRTHAVRAVRRRVGTDITSLLWW